MNERTLLNFTPMRTWNWLKVNETQLSTPIPPRRAYRHAAVGETSDAIVLPLMFGNTWAYATNAPVRIGKEWEHFVEKNANVLYDVALHGDETLRFDFAIDDENPFLVDDITFLVEEGERGTAILHYRGDGWHAGRTRMLVRSGAKAKIVLIQNLSDAATHTSALSVAVDDDAELDIVCIDMGAAEAVVNVNVEMWGANARVAMHTLYLGSGDRRMDINYRTALHGRENQVDMLTSGVLMGHCHKVYRGTLDFISGCAGSKGTEEENTMLLSKDARHLSVPILLCGEDDVEGAHAASTGKIDENKLFYLMSRGLTEKEARKLIVEAMFAPVLERIGDEELQAQLMNDVREKLDHVESISQ